MSLPGKCRADDFADGDIGVQAGNCVVLGPLVYLIGDDRGVLQ
jgi:hypothetical protein